MKLQDPHRNWSETGIGRIKLASKGQAYKNLVIDRGRGSNWVLVGAVNSRGSRNHVMVLHNWAADNFGRQLGLNTKFRMVKDRDGAQYETGSWALVAWQWGDSSQRRCCQTHRSGSAPSPSRVSRRRRGCRRRVEVGLGLNVGEEGEERDRGRRWKKEKGKESRRKNKRIWTHHFNQGKQILHQLKL